MSLAVGDQPAIVVTRESTIVVLLLLDVRHGVIDHVHAVGDPIGLARSTRREPD
jgi:hypothetical protein